MMKVLVALSCFVAVVLCENCYTQLDEACKDANTKVTECSALYGAATTLTTNITNYANTHLVRSFEYLLMSSHFGNFEKNREGLKKLYRKLSDGTWEDAIKLINYVTLRGGKVDLQPYRNSTSKIDEEIFVDVVVETTELQSLAKALAIQKDLADDALSISKGMKDKDPEMAAYLEDEFQHKQAKSIRQLAGYVNDLKQLLVVDKGGAKKENAEGEAGGIKKASDKRGAKKEDKKDEVLPKGGSKEPSDKCGAKKADEENEALIGVKLFLFDEQLLKTL